MNSIQEEKKKIRLRISGQRDLMSPSVTEEKSRAIFGKIAGSSEYLSAETVFIYMDLAAHREVMTRDFIGKIWMDGKKAAVPKCENGEMRFYYISYFAQLEPGTCGILEPVTHCPGIVSCADSDEEALVVMPGIAFDEKRHRIGFGGGYYDRYLKKHRRHRTIAPAFDFQVLDSVPYDDNDVCPDKIYTETRVIS